MNPRIPRIRLSHHEKPWIRPASENRRSSDPSLCIRCCNLDFKALFSRPFIDYIYKGPSGSYEVPAHILGSVRGIREQMNCVFCDLVRKSFNMCNEALAPLEEVNGRPVNVSLESVACGLYGPISPYQWESEDIDKPEPFSVKLHLGLDPSGIWKRVSTSGHQPETPDWRAVIHRVDESVNDPNKLCCGRRVGTKGPDLALISKWLQLCDENHGICNAGKETFEYPARLIDVSRGCLVEKSNISLKPKYAALSYVWGKAHFITLNSDTSQSLHTPGSISIHNIHIPATIRDAVKICIDLKKDYLWVDALCIKQDDLKDKMSEIRSMDEIYGGASLTIVAAFGDRANAGLPGIDQTTRVHSQHVLELDGFQLANRLPSAQELIDFSFWNSRAWTYQERLLSRRLLVFTESQVFFRCCEMQCREDTVSEYSVQSPKSSDHVNVLQNDEGGDNPLPTTISSFEYPQDSMNEFQKYAYLATEFSKRNLSYESDIFNAFQGIMSQLGYSVFKSETEYNMPVRLIDIAILWRPLGPLKQRDFSRSEGVIPSWAWSWWVGPIEYPEQLNLAERTLSERIEQFEATPLQMPPTIPAYWIKNIESSSNTSTRGDYTREIIDGEICYSTEECYTIKFNTSGLLCRPANQYHLQDLQSIRFSHGILTLKTSVAQFYISKDHVDELFPIYPNTPACNTTDHLVCHLTIIDSNGARAGCVVVDGHTSKDLKPGIFSFVKLSRTTLTHSDDDPSWDNEMQAFAGNPGDPSINPDFVRERNEKWFDSNAFDSSICWCLYNVMMVNWREDGVGVRLGIGKMHVDAFDAATSSERQVNLG